MALPETLAKRSINVFQPTFAYEEWEAVGKLMVIDWPGKNGKVTEFEHVLDVLGGLVGGGNGRMGKIRIKKVDN